MSNTVNIFGQEITVKVGSTIKPERWLNGSPLVASNWDAAEFRLPTHNGGPIESIAVNVKITGRTFQYIEGDYWVRVQIEWVGDGEPSTFSGGWLKKTW